MTDSLVSVVVGGLIGGGFAVVANVVAGMFNYKATVRKRETERYRTRLIQGYEDIAAFYHLEQRYVHLLSTLDPSRTAESWRLRVRREQRRDGKSTPSEHATANHAEHEAQVLRDRQS